LYVFCFYSFTFVASVPVLDASDFTLSAKRLLFNTVKVCELGVKMAGVRKRRNLG
jgi:hypothetical protein